MNDNRICPYANERLKNHWCERKRGYCHDGIGALRDDESYEKFTIINQNEVCCKCSLFGGTVFEITDKDIEVLKSGKVLSFLDEYSTFLIYKND